MRRLTTLILLVGALLTLAQPAHAGNSEQKAALRRGAAWAAKTLERELPAAPKVKALDVKTIGVLVRPQEEGSWTLYRPLSNAIADLDGFTEVWPKADINAFVDMVFLHPEEPRYDEASLLKLGGTFQNAQALLLVRYVLSKGEAGATELDVDLSLWDGKTAQKLWGANHQESVNLSQVVAIAGLIDSGRIDDALERLTSALAGTEATELRAELEQLKTKATRLKDHAKALQQIQAFVDQSKLDEALEAIGSLYTEGDGALRDSLFGLLSDTRTKILARAVSMVQAGKFEDAGKEVAGIEGKYPGDADLARMLGPIHRRLQAAAGVATREAEAKAEAERVRLEEKAKDEQARLDKLTEAERVRLDKRVEGYREQQAEKEDAGNRTWLLGIAAGFLLLLIVLSVAISKRRRVSRREIGLDELESEADQAERVKEVLTRDMAVRERMLRELDRAEDALAEAHHKAQGGGKADVAEELHAASQQLQELRRRVKLVQAGDPQEFLKGRLPKKNLEALVAFVPAVGGQMEELTKEAMAAHDAVASNGNPSKNLKLMGGMCLQIQGKLAERESFFQRLS